MHSACHKVPYNYHNCCIRYPDRVHSLQRLRCVSSEHLNKICALSRHHDHPTDRVRDTRSMPPECSMPRQGELRLNLTKDNVHWCVHGPFAVIWAQLVHHVHLLCVRVRVPS